MDHYQTALNCLRSADRADIGRETQQVFQAEALTHAVLFAGSILAELLAMLKAASEPGLAEHDEGTSYCTSAPEHPRDGVTCR